jgi:two-component system sensor histidine kinase QseC
MTDAARNPAARSLRWRLLRWVTLTTLVVWAGAAVLSYRAARHEVQELMDGQMLKTARLLLADAGIDPALLKGLPERMAEIRGAKSRRSELALEYQLVAADGALVVRSANAPAMPADARLGRADIEHAGRPWRSLILETADGRYRVQVAHSIQDRDREALEIASKTVVPMGLLFPLLIGAIYLAVRRGLKPLDDLAGDVAARSPENLSPLALATAPTETAPLVKALNELLRRLGTTIENERRFTADAAHELRTPLAALKVQAQVAMATQDAAMHRHALGQVLAGADRATRMVEQLLRLARLDPIAKLPAPMPIDLNAVATQAVADAHGTAAARQQQLQAVVAERATTIDGDAELLAAALRNLVDNALRHASEHGSVTVRVGAEHGEPFVSVTDTGPGVPPEELPRLVERFYRGRTVTAEGSGLGLAIVQRIAELHGARLEVENVEGGGFVARLRWHDAARSAPPRLDRLRAGRAGTAPVTGGPTTAPGS